MAEKVAVVVLNWNGIKHLEYCIPSLLKTDYPSYKIIVVDNASSDGSVGFLKKKYPDVTVIQNKENLAWAGGNNVGIRYAIKNGFTYVALVNNDIEVDSRWLKEAVGVAKADKRIGGVGFKVYGEVRKGDYKAYSADVKAKKPVKVTDTDNIIGCALFLKTSVFENLGLFDETYFIYCEETDFQARMTKAGYLRKKISIPIFHNSEGADWGKTPLRPAYLTIRNTIRYAFKVEPIWKIPLTIGYVFHMGANPFAKVDMTDATQRRLRPKNVFFNFFLDLYCLGWNIVNLPVTIVKRVEDNKRIKVAGDQMQK